ncbi:hypothetical protein [Caloranaerobacter sp. DY30410]|uniref:hypothetical protein n=1 Tax=Caloranaerobacter sp. DY30410 TaxID=3238305 RepID=UPI003CFEAA8B
MAETEYIITEFNFEKSSLEVKESKICVTPGSVSKAEGKNFKLKKGIFYSE